MNRSTQRAFALLLTVAALATSAAEPEARSDAVRLSLGETAFIQLSSGVPTGRPVAAIRVENPNRDYEVIKVTFEAGRNSGANQLKVRNGYDQLVLFATGCPESAESDRPQRLMVGVPPGREAEVGIPSATETITLCNFTVSLAPLRQ